MPKIDGPAVHGAQATLRLNGGPVADWIDVARMVRAAWPQLRFAASDVEAVDTEQGAWLIPIPLELLNVDVSVDASPSATEVGFIEIIWP